MPWTLTSGAQVLSTIASAEYALTLFTTGFGPGKVLKVGGLMPTTGGWLARAHFFGSPDLATSYYVEIDSTNVRLWKRTLGGSPSALASAAAHGLTAETNYQINIRLNGTVIEVRLGSVDAIVTSYDFASDSPPPNTRSACGISSTFDGCRITAFDLCTLEAIYTPRADGMWHVAGGVFYYTLDGRTWSTIPGAPALVTSGRVGGVELLSKVYLVDGTNILTFDTTALTLTKTVLTGSPAGYTGAGITRATDVRSYLGRLVLVDGRDLLFSAVDDPTNFNTGEKIPGAAFSFSASFPGLIGEPIRAFYAGPNAEAVIFCQRSIWRMRGDPVLGPPENTRIADNFGGTGPDCVTMASEGLLIAHTTQGACVIRSDSLPVLISQPVLTDIIQRDPGTLEDHLAIIVARDPRRSGVHFFFTLDGTAGDSITLSEGIWYSELVGRFEPGPGWYPCSTRSTHDATAACIFRGELIIGTRTGRLLRKSDTVSTDVGLEIDTRLDFSLVMDRQSTAETIISWLSIDWGSQTTGAVVRLYAGFTAEQAFTQATQTPPAVAPLWSETITQNRPSTHWIQQRVRAGVLSIRGGGANTRFTVDACWSEQETVADMGGQPYTPTVPERCGPPTTPATTPTTPTGPGGGPGGEPPDPPDPEECVLCSDFMDDNWLGKDFDSAANRAIQMGGFEDNYTAEGAIRNALEILYAANICDLPENADDIVLEYVQGDDATNINEQKTFGEWITIWDTYAGLGFTYKYRMVFSCEMQTPPI